MHVLYITRACSPTAGGMERLSYEFTQVLKTSSTLKYTIVAHKGTRRTAPFFVLVGLVKSWRHARHVDVIHLADPLLSFIGWVLHHWYKVPVVVTVHGLDITYRHPLYKLYLKLFFDRFTHYLPISTYVAQLLQKRAVTGGITTLTPGISVDYYSPTVSRTSLNDVLAFKTKSTIILFTSGRLVTRKGHAWFIQNVLPSLPDTVHYVIAGSGPEQSTIEAVIKAANLENRVHLLGRVSDHELAVLYNTVDAFIQPNIPTPHDVEGFGLVLLEAALCNRPVFAANLEGMTDAIHPGKNGTLLPPQDATAWQEALQGWLTTPHTNSTAREYTLKTFSWKEHATAYHTILSQLQKTSAHTS